MRRRNPAMCEKCRERKVREIVGRSPLILRGPTGTNDALISGRNLLRIQMRGGCYEVMPDGEWVRL